ncbi:MAG: putative sulfate exporter family transporter, partial [Pseudomonadota bacterium]
FTVMGVTVLSTIAMILYPIIVNLLNLGDLAAGVFLGGTIHDVAQVVGAGFSVSESVGDTATLVKLIRVSLLAPVVIIAALLIRRFATPADGGERPPIIPMFVVGFLVLATLNSLGLIPVSIANALSEASRWLLLTAIAAVGMKTNLKKVLAVGGSAIALIITQTIFIASIILSGVYFLT